MFTNDVVSFEQPGPDVLEAVNMLQIRINLAVVCSVDYIAMC